MTQSTGELIERQAERAPAERSELRFLAQQAGGCLAALALQPVAKHVGLEARGGVEDQQVLMPCLLGQSGKLLDTARQHAHEKSRQQRAHQADRLLWHLGPEQHLQRFVAVVRGQGVEAGAAAGQVVAGAQENGQSGIQVGFLWWRLLRVGGRAPLPAHPTKDHILADVVLKGRGDLEHPFHDLLGQIMRFDADVDQPLIGGIVVVLLGLLTRVIDALDADLIAQAVADALGQLGQLIDAEGFHDLVEDAQLAGLGGGLLGLVHALQGVFDVEVAARLPALAVDGERVADDGLDDEAVDDGAEDLVVIEQGAQARVGLGFFGFQPINRALHQVGDLEIPHAHAKPEQIGVHDLGGVVERRGLAGEEELALAALVLDLDPALFDVDVGSAVFAHGADVDDMGVAGEVAQCPDQVVGDEQVVGDGAVGVLVVDQRIGGGGLLGVVDDGLGEAAEAGVERPLVAHAPVEQAA